MDYKEIWQTLSKIDVSKHIEKKAGLSYLSWAWAWGTMMEHYPEFEIAYDTPVQYEDGSMEVACIVTIGSCSRTMWLPVMDHMNKAIKNPDARAISDAKQRCMVKCFALFGLAHYIYAGEDLPDGNGGHAPVHAPASNGHAPAPAPAPAQANGAYPCTTSQIALLLSALEQDSLSDDLRSRIATALDDDEFRVTVSDVDREREANKYYRGIPEKDERRGVKGAYRIGDTTYTRVPTKARASELIEEVIKSGR